MRWPVFAMFAFAAVVMQLSVRGVLMLHSVQDISPDLVAAVAVFVCLFAQPAAALWACWILGMLMDLAPPEGPANYHVLGVHALGYVAGGYLVLQLRTMVFRRRAITVGFLTALALVASGLVAVMLLTIRSWYPGELPQTAHGPLAEFGLRLLAALYSGAVAIPIGWLLNATWPLWGFQTGTPRRAW